MPGEVPDADRSGAAAPPATFRRSVEALAVLALGVGSIVLVLTGPLLETGFAGTTMFLAALAAFYLAYRWDLLGAPAFLGAWVGLALAFAVFSVVTGRFNGLTDEPYATPAFVHLLPNLYGQPLQLSYTEYGSPEHLTAWYVYLPLLTFVQAPGLDYRWLALAAWVATVYLLRANGAAVVLVGGPFVGLVAANGFNDLIPFLALTATLVALRGTRSRVVEIAALGLKQFANGIIVVHHLWHRRWGRALLAAGVSALFLLPFAFLAPYSVLCNGVLLGAVPACPGGVGTSTVSGFYRHINYFAWGLWVLAVFGTSYLAELKGPGYAAERAELAHWRGERSDSVGPPPVPDWGVFVLPWLRLHSKLRRGPPTT